jgi:hypothetical protein
VFVPVTAGVVVLLVNVPTAAKAAVGINRIAPMMANAFQLFLTKVTIGLPEKATLARKHARETGESVSEV